MRERRGEEENSKGLFSPPRTADYLTPMREDERGNGASVRDTYHVSALTKDVSLFFTVRNRYCRKIYKRKY